MLNKIYTESAWWRICVATPSHQQLSVQRAMLYGRTNTPE